MSNTDNKIALWKIIVVSYFGFTIAAFLILSFIPGMINALINAQEMEALLGFFYALIILIVGYILVSFIVLYKLRDRLPTNIFTIFIMTTVVNIGVNYLLLHLNVLVPVFNHP